MKTEICPYTQICPIYENYSRFSADKRLDIINYKSPWKIYSCLAKEILEDWAKQPKNKPKMEKPVESTPEGLLIKKIPDNAILTSPSAPCSYITMLNLLTN
ncbi:MAG: hypothetical protein PHQ66_02225 [Candidatus Nanoarchaeia archaeon]|nr:hypothetical protein [Candidatus Nanoarchaeia archaeon]MDD5357813.1 hypothetical protein [Candidatus Nanoarchaeia archaeon]MDD5588732.1 hypothetical protein [Candidatus Nanoarchaeia archaeon]